MIYHSYPLGRSREEGFRNKVKSPFFNGCFCYGSAYRASIPTHLWKSEGVKHPITINFYVTSARMKPYFLKNHHKKKPEFLRLFLQFEVIPQEAIQPLNNGHC